MHATTRAAAVALLALLLRPAAEAAGAAASATAAAEALEAALPPDREASFSARKNLAACSGGQYFTSATWTSSAGQLRFNGKPFRIRGTNWFGFETTDVLWSLLYGSANGAYDLIRNNLTTPAVELNRRLDLVAAQGFNAIRLPLSVDRCNDLSGLVGGRFTVGNLIRTVLDGAAARGIVVALDMHRMEPCCAEGQEWFGDKTWTPVADWTSAWMKLLTEFGSHPALFAIDLFNEPHDSVNWGVGGPFDWQAAASKLIRKVIRDQPQYTGLFIVEGVDSNTTASPYANSYGYFWGENVQGAYATPVTAGGKRVVYSVHAYGPSVYNQTYFSANNFPGNMEAIWDVHFGKWMEQWTNRALVVGEWGGTDVYSDHAWQTAFSRYMVKRCINDNFYWALNANSGDTGGWLMEGDVINTGKLQHIQTAQPYPSGFVGPIAAGSYCFKAGASASAACA